MFGKYCDAYFQPDTQGSQPKAPGTGQPGRQETCPSAWAHRKLHSKFESSHREVREGETISLDSYSSQVGMRAPVRSGSSAPVPCPVTPHAWPHHPPACRCLRQTNSDRSPHSATKSWPRQSGRRSLPQLGGPRGSSGQRSWEAKCP